MSGWVATINLDGQPVDSSLLQHMTEAMRYRGLDGVGTRVFGSVGLGHALFATLEDIPEPVGPFTLDGESWLVGDVRIDAREELSRKLVPHIRAPLDEAPDAALVLHAYRVWGEACLEHLLGDFAFAIWDVARQRLFCARDQMGIRPAYVARMGNSVVVSNTLDAMRRHGAWTGALDDTAIVDFLVFGELMDLEATGFAAVRRLRAGHRLIANDCGVSTRRYWTLPIQAPQYRARYSEYLEAIRDVLGCAVRDRLRTTRAAVSMSGGLDSSAVAAITRQVRPDLALHAFTCIFDHLIPDDERHFSTLVARHLGVEHTLIAVDDRKLYQNDEGPQGPVPEHNPWFGAGIRERQLMAGAGRIQLTGMGADPALLPWPADLRMRIPGRRALPMLHAMARHLIRRRSLPPLGLRWKRTWATRDLRGVMTRPSWIVGGAADSFDASERLALLHSQLHGAHPWRESAYHFLSNEFWSKIGDREDAGNHGIARSVVHPFLDLRVIATLLAVPSSPFVGDKRVLRDVLSDILPREVTERPKAPLSRDPLDAAIPKTMPGLLERWKPSPRVQRYVDVRRLANALESGPFSWPELTAWSLGTWIGCSFEGNIKGLPDAPSAAA